ncbi:carbamoyl-phosphate synthase large subunit [Candidatus Vidania fulgoroideae]|uniref:Carbamoyl-phosphate synthase large subunit n=1 Tax=Candidatus Vidania fulgoroideorum TaxID=881286 RepID=A0A975ADY4_9PROT|nr:carbamoyl-phosphate synthase large subunit [Candidatus Vidania fulgoroideae]
MSKKKILVIGAGPIVIGQACEFDYSGVQACSVLRDLNYNVYLLNNNPATVMTDRLRGLVVYIEPINIYSVVDIVLRENIKYILPNVGGQTGLNLVLKLYKYGYINRFNLKILGTSIKSIINSEDRNKFRNKMISNGIKLPESFIVNNYKDSLLVRDILVRNHLKSEVIIRTSYTLGGLGGGISKDISSFKALVSRALRLTGNSEILIEESLIGNKEYELEILTDKFRNFIIVCSIENIDKVGVHTGDSLAISPIQTLTNYEFQRLRNLTKLIIKILDLSSCGANIQFSICSLNGEVKLIEVNPRVSRSSALASKATGYPIAKISTLLSVGIPFHYIKYKISGRLPSFYEPTLDYFVFKTPKFCNLKFGCFETELNTQMKSTGESMSIGRTLEYVIQKSFDGLSLDNIGFSLKSECVSLIALKANYPNENRLRYLYESYKLGISVNSNLDPYFLENIRRISVIDNLISKTNPTLVFSKIRYLKSLGFSDSYISIKLNKPSNYITSLRIKNNILPVYKKVDTCSSEFKTNSSYIYSSYSGNNELTPISNSRYIIVGSGPNRVGQGIEFDYCCVHTSVSLNRLGHSSIIINNNPETVSTDYDVSSRLYFLNICFEEVLNVFLNEIPIGIILQFCGQLSRLFLTNINRFNLKILGTSIKSIINSEDRNKFRNKMISNGIKLPESFIVNNYKDSLLVRDIYPALIRPSYVLGGLGMKVISSNYELNNLLSSNKLSKYLYPLTVDKFLVNAIEYDVDCININNKVSILPLVKHVDSLGVHSGDSYSYIVGKDTNYMSKLFRICKKIVLSSKIVGFCNIQLAYHLGEFYLIELNPRASRTIPFIIKSTGFNYIHYCIKGLLGFDLGVAPSLISSSFIFLKKPVFSYSKFPNSDPLLGPEMKSTGESMSIGRTLEEAFYKTSLHNLLQKKHTLSVLFISNLKYKYLSKIQGILRSISNIALYSNINFGIVNSELVSDSNIPHIKFDFGIVIDTNNKYKYLRSNLQSRGINLFTDISLSCLFLNCLVKYSKHVSLISTNDIFK